jgi:hypothetical protein
MKVWATALLATGTALFSANLAVAMPVGSLAASADEVSAPIERVGYACGPRGCVWLPEYVAPIYVLPRIYGGYYSGYADCAPCGPYRIGGWERPYGFRGYGVHVRYRGWWY